MWIAGLAEAWTQMKIVGRNNNNLINADGITLMTERKQELKSLLIKGNEESKKSDLKPKFH